MMKKLISLVMLIIMVVGLLSGCTGENKAKDVSKDNGAFDLENEIVAVTREEGSGTRGAFVELLK